MTTVLRQIDPITRAWSAPSAAIQRRWDEAQDEAGRGSRFRGRTDSPGHPKHPKVADLTDMAHVPDIIPLL